MRSASSTLAAHRREWETLAALDPLWAILAHPGKKFGRWDQAEFLTTGATQIETILARGVLLGLPRHHDDVLDFGCGVGRLAAALSDAFGSYTGIDLSERMLARARELHGTRPNASFEANSDSSLGRFADDSFDVVVSIYVLQHLRDHDTVLRYLASLLRVLRPGGLLVVQLPAAMPRPEKLLYDTRGALYAALTRLGLSSSLVYRRLGLFPSSMNTVAEASVVRLLEANGASVRAVERARLGIAVSDRTYYVSKGD